jgi:hypothetical protein
VPTSSASPSEIDSSSSVVVCTSLPLLDSDNEAELDDAPHDVEVVVAINTTTTTTAAVHNDADTQQLRLGRLEFTN